MNIERNLATAERIPVPEAITAYGSVVERDGIAYAITEDGERGIPVPSKTGSALSLLLRLQNKVYEEQNTDATHVFQTFNCRKSVFVATGAIDFENAVIDLGHESGEVAMFNDVARLIEHKDGGVVSLTDYADFEDVLDSYTGSFPCVVHVFESEEEMSQAEVIAEVERLHRVHSFLVLGEDDEGYVCFQKVGPAVEQPFTITDLDFVTHLYRNQNNRVGHFVFGPSR